MIRWLANNLDEFEIDVEAEVPCIWKRFSDRQKWSIILYALCNIVERNNRSYTCLVCRDQLPGDFLGLSRDNQTRAWLALLTLLVAVYDTENEFPDWHLENDEPCRDDVWRLNVTLNIALQFLEALSIETDPDVLMCSDNNPYWNVKLQDVPAWLFQLFCDIYQAVAPEVVEFPEAFSWAGPEIEVTRSGAAYSQDIDPDDYENTATVDRYADVVNGSDSNDGTTPETATKTLTNLRTKFGTITGETLHVHFLTAGVYPVESTFSGTVDWNMTCDDPTGNAIIAVQGKYGTDFSIHSGGPAYKIAAYVASAVIDFANRDATTGAPQKLTAATGADDPAKIADCIATAGTYHNATDGTLYVHTFDDRAPDSNLVAVYEDLAQAFRPTKNTYLKNITLVGGTVGALYINGASAEFNFVFDGCEFVYSAGDAVQIELDSGFVLMHDCTAYHGTSDGFSYHDDTSGTTLCVLEDGCVAAGNGTASGNNASTIHDGVTMIRISCDYYGSQRTIHDIGDVAASMNFGCSVDTGAVGWRCGDGGGTVMWLDGCSVGTHATNDVQIAGANDAIYYTNMDVTGWSVSIGAGGTWEEY